MAVHTRKRNRVALTVVSAMLLLGSTAVSATAADGGNSDAGYYRSAVTGIRPPITGLEVSVEPDGQLTLVNDTGKTVVVLGYANEEYLRITPDGVQENVASLTSILNSQEQPGPMPSDPTSVAPEWVDRASTPQYTWNDFRTRWTNEQRPPIVVDDPHRRHQVFAWSVQLTVDNQPVTILGEVIWIGTPWLTTTQSLLLGMAVALLLVLGALLLRRHRLRRRQRGSVDPRRDGAGLDSSRHVSADQDSAGRDTSRQASSGPVNAVDHQVEPSLFEESG